MAVFVDLEEEDVDPPLDVQQTAAWNGGIDAIKSRTTAVDRNSGNIVGNGDNKQEVQGEEAAHGPAVRENPNRNSMTQALGCYPIVMSVAANIDLNTLDSLSRTCRQIREGLLQYRTMLLVSTMHCVNENLPIDPEETLRYRARAGNWFYMEEAGRTNYNGKSGQCARDLVAGCRRCGTVVCRNCAIKPPAPIVLRDRHRRLCISCTKAPLGSLVKPRLDPDVSLESDDMQRAICRCDSDGVWLCQPCGRSIRGDDYDYKSIWKWRNQYTDVLGGLGTGIGDGDRGVICGRDRECLAAREREQETDCDAEDAREADYSYTTSLFNPITPVLSNTSSHSSAAGSSSLSVLWGGNGGTNGEGNGNGNGSTMAAEDARIRTPSPALLGPGYERHEIEGIGGVVKKKLVRMVKVGACVPEFRDEKDNGEILGREVKGQVRSWCGWCWRVIPGKKDYEVEKIKAAARKTNSGTAVAAAGNGSCSNGSVGRKGKAKDEGFMVVMR